MKTISFLSVAMLAMCFSGRAQKLLTEGSIRYSVSIGPVAGGTTFTEHAGTYTITIKGRLLRKELSMNTGYHAVIITNGNTGAAYSLQASGGQNYAIQLRHEDIAEKQKPYEGFAIGEAQGSSTIAGWPCQKASVRYKDGSTSVLYYTSAWNTEDSTVFDRFPGLKGIPLSFEYRNEEGITMHFSAEALETSPVESALFRVPPDYRIISNAEYRKGRE